MMAVIRGSRLKSRTRAKSSAAAATSNAEAQPAEQPADRVSQENRRERLRREIFDRLVAAARQLMFDRSLDDARVQDITNLADVGKGTFFNFFAAKELVLPEIMRERVRLVRESVDQVKRGQASSREVLDYFMNSGIERKQAPLDRHNYYDSFFRSMVHDERVRSGISDILHEVEQLAVDLVKLGQGSGEFRDDHDASDLARYLVQVFYGQQWIAWIHGAGVEPRELEANSQLTFDLLLSPSSRSAKAGRVAQSPISTHKSSNEAHTERKRRSRKRSQ